LYELARHPSLQEELRAEVTAARAESQGDLLDMLKRIPLVKGALKETLRCETWQCPICNDTVEMLDVWEIVSTNLSKMTFCSLPSSAIFLQVSFNIDFPL